MQAKVYKISGILIFVFLADALLAYWTPILIQRTFNSSLVMGFVMSLSSLVGITSDFFVPQIVKTISVRRLLISSIFLSITFSFLLFSSVSFSFWIVLIAVSVWGLYYELLSFASKQFVAFSVPKPAHASAWGVIYSAKSLAYTVSPLIAGYLLITKEINIAIVAITLALISLWLVFLFIKPSNIEEKIEIKHFSIFTELGYWKELLNSVWPVITISLLIGTVEAVFWTAGTIYSEQLAQVSFLGRFYIPAYILPSILIGPLLSKAKIENNKKRLSMLFFSIASFLLIISSQINNIYLILLTIFASGVFSALTYPLLDAVYSDIISRMGKQKMHLIGLASSSNSLAYIVGPIIGGILSTIFSEKITFGIIGIICLIVTFVVFIFTPRKIYLHQSDIQNWK